MNKKDIYEHLANIYLDNSGKKKKKRKTPFHYKRFYFFSISIIILFSVLMLFPFKKLNLTSQIALVIQPTAVKINFDFNSAKKEMYSFDLKELDLSKFDALNFSARKLNPLDIVHLRVELMNAFKEKSEVYVKDLKYQWQDYKINLSEFKNINDWTKISHLAFVVEEWNVKGERGIIYIDDVKIIKER